MNESEQQQWKNSRKGFKHELILTLADVGFSVREAELTIDAIFSAIKASLLKKESVEVDGFGRWCVEEIPQKRRRKWRFGRVVELKPNRVAFQFDKQAFSGAPGDNWVAHPSWEEHSKQPPKMRGARKAAFLKQQERERRSKLLAEYTGLIMKFSREALRFEDLHLFWTLRHTSWFYGQASEIPKNEFGSIATDDAASLIKLTKPQDNPRIWPNETIERVRWYARWVTRLERDRDIWQEAERTAADMTIRGHWHLPERLP